MKSSQPKRAQVRVRQPKQARARNTVTALVEAAARVLVERGWKGFNTNAIAVRAGTSIGSLYEYFPNKQALLDAVANAHLERAETLLSSAEARVREAGSPSHVARLLVQGFVALHEQDPDLHRLLSGRLPLSDGVQARAERLLARTVCLVEHALRDAVNEPGLTARLLVDTTDAVVHRWVIDNDGRPVAVEQLVRELESMFTAYLGGLVAQKRPVRAPPPPPGQTRPSLF